MCELHWQSCTISSLSRGGGADLNNRDSNSRLKREGGKICNMETRAWKDSLRADLRRLQLRDTEEAHCALAEALSRAQAQSGLNRIAFDHEARSLGVNVVNFKVYGSEGALCAALKEEAEPKARREVDGVAGEPPVSGHAWIPSRVRTAFLISARGR